jgi:hypothetical protein
MRHGVITWDKQGDDMGAIKMIVKLAPLLAKIRGNVVSYQTKVMTYLKGSDKDEGSNNSNNIVDNAGFLYEYGHSKPIIERPERATKILYNLARAHAFEVCGRHYITKEDLPMIIKIVLSAANRDRIAVIKSLLHANKDLSGLVYAELNTTRDVDMKHVVTRVSTC